MKQERQARDERREKNLRIQCYVSKKEGAYALLKVSHLHSARSKSDETTCNEEAARLFFAMLASKRRFCVERDRRWSEKRNTEAQ